MHQISIILLAFVFLFGSIFGNVHNYHLRNAVDVSLLEPMLPKEQSLNSGNVTEKEIDEQQIAPIVTETNPFGLPGVSANTRKDIKIVDGDIAAPVEESKGIFRQSQKWPHGIVPVEIDNSYSNDQKNVIINGMVKIMEATNKCIRFVWRENNPYWLRIHPGNGCWSYLGKVVNNGHQDLSLQNSGCVHEGTVIHELLHALGHVHEHNRADRDGWVRINWGNISPGMDSAFQKYSADQVDTYNLPYNYMSIMHYHSTAFSKNGQRTIDAIKPGLEGFVHHMGRSGRLDGWDVDKLKKRYGC